MALPERELFRHINPMPDKTMLECFCSGIRTNYRTMNLFRSTKLYPGIMEIFSYLRQQNILWAVVSSKPKPALKRLMEMKGWQSYIPLHYSLDSIPGADTKAAVYDFLMGHKLFQKHPVCIGDTWSDIAAARACGFPNIAVLYGDGDRAALLGEQPDYMAKDGWELLKQLVWSEKHNDR